MNPSDTAGAEPAHTPPLAVLATSLLTFVLWLLFVGTRAAHELELGLLVTALSVLFCVFVHRRNPNHISLSFKDILQAWRIPWYIVSDIAEITLVLAKDLLGIAPAASLYRVAPFTPFDEDSTHLGRRILVTAYTTATPSIIVLGIDVPQRRMLFHQIKRSPLPDMTRALGAHL